MKKNFAKMALFGLCLTSVGCSRALPSSNQGAGATEAVFLSSVEAETASPQVEPATTEETQKKAKYMTLALAKEVCENIPEFGPEDTYFDMIYKIVNTMNELVEVKGVDVNCGVPLYKFYFDTTKKEYVQVSAAGVEYVNEEKNMYDALYRLPIEPIPETDPYDAEEKDNLLTRSYEKATDEQRAQLDKLTEEYGAHACHYEKKIKMIMGELPEDQPSITLEQAREICHTITRKQQDEEEIEKGIYDGGTLLMVDRFNEIAGACDYADSHKEAYIYYLPDGKYIRVHMCSAVVYTQDRKEDEYLFPYIGMPVE